MSKIISFTARQNGNSPEPFPNPAHAQVLPFPKTAHARFSRAKTARVQDSHVSEIGRNEHLRADRYLLWRRADAKFEFYRRLRELHFAIGIAKDRGILAHLDCPVELLKVHICDEPWVLNNHMLEQMHEARVELLLTPAPTVAAMERKRKEVERQYCFTVDEIRQIERIIAADDAWLKAHPARQRRGRKRGQE